MPYLLIIIPIIDFFWTAFVLSHTRKTGGFHYLLSALHKLCIFIMISIATVMFQYQHGVVYPVSFVIVGILSFILIKTFELNDYFLSSRNIEYNMESMTPEGREMMQLVLEDIKSQSERTFFEKIKSIINNHVISVLQDIDVLIMLITDNEATKSIYKELHKILGNNSQFSSMTNIDLIFLVKSRIIMNFLCLITGILLILS